MGRRGFNWFELTQTALYNQVLGNLLSNELETVEIKTLQRNTSKHLKSLIPINIRNCRSAKIGHGELFVSGFYFSDRDLEGLNPIQIEFHFNNKDTHIDLTYINHKRLAKLIVDVVFHEMIHMRQYRSRGWKELKGHATIAHSKNGSQEYYGHRDEIGAYAFNIATDLWHKFGTDINGSKTWLDTNNYRKSKFNAFKSYMEVFEHDHTHPVIKCLKKKIVSYLPNIDIDKPFRTDRHLTY
jgi:hypothetical protein